MHLALDRSFWTPVLLPVTIALGYLRMSILAPVDAPIGSELEAAAFFAGVLGGALLPWAAGGLAAYGHWFWCKTRRDGDYMQRSYPYARRRVLHGVVLVVCLLMASESLWRLLAK